MTLIKRTTTKTNAQKKHAYVNRAPACRRCGTIECTCSEEDIDAGGPA